MKKVIEVAGNTFEYLLIESTRARHVRMSVDAERGLIVTKPRRIPQFFVDHFISSKSEWIITHMQKRKTMPPAAKLKVSFHEFESNKFRALKLFKEEVEFFNSFYKFPYKKITVRNQKTLWGSCTRDGKLQFNYRLTLLPKRMRNYVIVHEICHLKEHNHGPMFWKLVSQTIPDYRQIRRTMNGYSLQ